MAEPAGLTGWSEGSRTMREEEITNTPLIRQGWCSVCGGEADALWFYGDSWHRLAGACNGLAGPGADNFVEFDQCPWPGGCEVFSPRESNRDI